MKLRSGWKTDVNNWCKKWRKSFGLNPELECTSTIYLGWGLLRTADVLVAGLCRAGEVSRKGLQHLSRNVSIYSRMSTLWDGRARRWLYLSHVGDLDAFEGSQNEALEMEVIGGVFGEQQTMLIRAHKITLQRFSGMFECPGMKWVHRLWKCNILKPFLS